MAYPSETSIFAKGKNADEFRLSLSGGNLWFNKKYLPMKGRVEYCVILKQRHVFFRMITDALQSTTIRMMDLQGG